MLHVNCKSSSIADGYWAGLVKFENGVHIYFFQLFFYNQSRKCHFSMRSRVWIISLYLWLCNAPKHPSLQGDACQNIRCIFPTRERQKGTCQIYRLLRVRRPISKCLRLFQFEIYLSGFAILFDSEIWLQTSQWNNLLQDSKLTYFYQSVIHGKV